MYVKELLKNCLIDDSVMKEVLECDKKQIVSQFTSIPVWKVEYDYIDMDDNDKEDICYIFRNEEDWDIIYSDFEDYIARYNRKHPHDIRYCVEIINYGFLGNIYLNIENG